MSNNNTTKENFKEFYEEIKPLMGGTSDFDELNNKPQESDTIDISDLDLPMPAKPTEYPVLFDESGSEYQVGLYKRADGKVKPVWRKDIKWTGTISANRYATIDTISNVETPISICGFINEAGSENYHQLGASNWNGVNFQNTGNVNVSAYISYGSGTVVRALAEYTKTTDEFRDL